MKRLKLSFALILIASALLLSAAKSGHPSPSPRPTAKPSEHAQLPQSQSDQQPTPVGATDLSHTPNGADASDAEKDQGRDATTIVVAISAVVSAVAAALMVWFNCQLIGVTDKMRQATADAAKAADAALHINRPAIVVTHVETHIIGTQDVLRGYTPNIYNLGAGPAEITGVFAHSRTFDAYGSDLIMAEEPHVVDLIWDARHDRKEFARTILGPGESLANYSAGYTPIANWTEDDIKAVEQGAKRRAVYGLIRYRSAVKDYWTRFFYWYDPAGRRFYRAERPELNERI